MRFFKSLIFIVLLFLPASSYAQEKLPEYTGWVNDFAGVGDSVVVEAVVAAAVVPAEDFSYVDRL